MLTKSEWLQKQGRRLRLSIAGDVAHARPAFVFGAQRSGTTMMAKVIGRCERAEIYLENDPEAFDNYSLRDLATIDELVRQSRADVVLFKSILDSQIAAELLDRYDRSKAIWIFRPYWDVVNSSLRQFRDHYQELDSMVRRPQDAGWRVKNVAESDMELVRFYHKKKVSDASARALLWYLRNQLLFQQVLDVDSRVAIINYDDIVRRPVE